MPPPRRPRPPATTLTPIELERQVPLAEAARLTDLTVKTLERHYRHLIRRLSPRRRAMKLRDVITIGHGQS
jgi:hypothetical protein